MKKHYRGIDVLRGLGILGVLTLHTAFYNFDGIYDLDLSNPPLIITLIGFLLMFAGMFAMISGFVHTIQTYRRIKEKEYNLKQAFKYSLMSGMYVLVIAYLYFLFTGPGIIFFESRRMDNSLLIELINNGKLIIPSLERLLYIDSVVMIGTNIILLALASIVGFKLIKTDKRRGDYFYILGVIVLLLSIFRIPLFNVYVQARDSGNYFVIIMLNWLVNKNNPILPFYAFALFGAWIASLIMIGDVKKTRIKVVISGLIFIIVGVFIYITAEETMLNRQIDYTWYGIMVVQIGLFKLMILGFLKIYDYSKKEKELNFISKFIYRFGVAGFTIFFIEQIFSSLVKRVMLLFNENLYLDIGASIIMGISISIIWGLFLIVWSKYEYRYGLEYFYSKFMDRFGGSEKGNKLKK